MPKNIVVCMDGTWNQPEREDGRVIPTNVLKLMRALRPTGDGGRCQVVFYGRGVGTGGWFDRIKGGAFGIGLSDNILDGYRFIANNYDAGDGEREPDEIYLFGFSRGAFTARSLAGMIGAVGLLEKLDMNRLPEAFALYRTPPEQRAKHPSYGLVHETRKVTIKFIGVWDTVGALGIPVTWLKWIGRRNYHFHNVELGSNVRFAYQALAIDEHRKPFEAAIWTRPSDPPKHRQEVEQMWFAGAHSNVGGGYPDPGLSDIALTWMMEKAQACGLSFDEAYARRCIQPSYDGVLVDSRTPVYRVWRRRYRKVRGRDDHLNERVHPSVRERMANAGSGYAPRNDYLPQIFAETDMPPAGPAAVARAPADVEDAAA